MGLGTLREVQDGSGDPLGGPGRLGGTLSKSVMGQGTFERSGTSNGTLTVVREGSGDPRGSPGWVGGRYITGWGTLPQVRDG